MYPAHDIPRAIYGGRGEGGGCGSIISSNPDYHPVMLADPWVSSNAPSLGSSGEPGDPFYDIVFSWGGERQFMRGTQALNFVQLEKLLKTSINNIPYVQLLTITKKVIIIPTSTNQLPTQKNICAKYHFCSNRYPNVKRNRVWILLSGDIWKLLQKGKAFWTTNDMLVMTFVTHSFLSLSHIGLDQFITNKIKFENCNPINQTWQVSWHVDYCWHEKYGL